MLNFLVDARSPAAPADPAVIPASREGSAVGAPGVPTERGGTAAGPLGLGAPLTRRRWLTRHAVVAAAVLVPRPRPWRAAPPRAAPVAGRRSPGRPTALRMAEIAPGRMQALAHQAVDAATAAGAQYADARVTRTVRHMYSVADVSQLSFDDEDLGLGVRVLVNGYWGFAAAPDWTPETAARLAQEAVRLATSNAKGPARAVELGTVPVVTGTWATPVRIDPFTVPVEQKLDFFKYWAWCAHEFGCSYLWGVQLVTFGRQERVLATSAGSLVTQTLYETGAGLAMNSANVAEAGNHDTRFALEGLGSAAKGWELLLDANIPEQIPRRIEARKAYNALKKKGKNAPIGRYTVVCDGETMAWLLGATLGVGTQLDRALGYEADAGGTSFVDDPLAMLGTFKLAAPLVTVTANRNVPGQLATVQWDDEGVVPATVPLVKDGVLVDMQTTRESAGWLAPYYHRRGMPVQSHGYAAAPDALSLTMQHMPNLELAPNPAAVGLEDLVANVQAGILLQGGNVSGMDFQARTGLLAPTGFMPLMREIRNGKLLGLLKGGTIAFDTVDLWRHVTAVGGAGTAAVVGRSRYHLPDLGLGGSVDAKGQPAQSSSFSVRGAAATLLNQPLIIPTERAR